MFGVEWLKRVLTTKPQERTRYVTESWLRVVLVLYWSVVTVVNSQSVYYALQTHPDDWVVGSVEKFRDGHLLRDIKGREKDAVIEVEFVYKGKTYRVSEKGYNFNRSIYVQGYWLDQGVCGSGKAGKVDDEYRRATEILDLLCYHVAAGSAVDWASCAYFLPAVSEGYAVA